MMFGIVEISIAELSEVNVNKQRTAYSKGKYSFIHIQLTFEKYFQNEPNIVAK